MFKTEIQFELRELAKSVNKMTDEELASKLHLLADEIDETPNEKLIKNVHDAAFLVFNMNDMKKKKANRLATEIAAQYSMLK